MSDLGYDAMAMGNREFHFLAPGLKSKVKLARFPILCTNLRSKTELSPSITACAIWRSPIRIVIFGLTVPMITKRMLASKLSPYWFDDPIETARNEVETMRDHADLLIALTHLGLKADVELAQSVPGIDIIVGGHTHAVLNEPMVVGSTTILQAGSWGRYLGRADVSGNSVKGRLINLTE